MTSGSGCANCPAKGCLTQYRGSTCSAQRARFGLADPLTNADRIRLMSDEELADYLDHFRCSNCMRRGNNCFPGDIENWLKEEVKQ